VDKPADKVSESLISESSEQTGADPFIGKVINNKYEVLDKLGGGGMGVVYRARHKELHRDYAVKFLLSSGPYGFDARQLARFEREARAASGLHHQNLIAITDFGTTDDGMPYLVMDLVRGDTVSDVIEKSGRIAAPEALEIAKQVCEGLEYAHGKGVIHRDLKPSNLMITRKEGALNVRILDFGIAKFGEDETDAGMKTLTQTGEIVGSPAYMSPEQAMGTKLDARSDIYALGCVLFEMLTGRAVFQGDSPLAIVVQHLNSDAPSVRDLREGRNVPAAIEKIVRQTLQKKPEDRYQSVADLHSDLKRASAGQALENEFATGRQLRRKFLSKSGKLAIAAIVVLAVLAIAIFFNMLVGTVFWRPKWKEAFIQAGASHGDIAALQYDVAMKEAAQAGLSHDDIRSLQLQLMIDLNHENETDAVQHVAEDVVKTGKDERTSVMARIYDQCAEAHLTARQFPQAVREAKYAIELKQWLKEPAVPLSQSMGRLGQIYRASHQFRLAEQIDFEAIKLLQNAGVRDVQESNLYFQLGNVYDDQHRPREALEFTTRAWELSKQLRGTDHIMTQDLAVVVRQRQAKLSAKP
jgi:tetratricopeptide (TPR) repeat protein